MGDIVNLRKACKQAARGRDQQQAAANRIMHGRNKAERKRENAEGERTRSHLDQHRIETGDQK
jgi:Domain of unknown function (DUF4169)